MDKGTEQKECRKFFEDWLQAYAEHLHLVRQGRQLDLVQPDVCKPPVAVKKASASGKPTNA